MQKLMGILLVISTMVVAEPALDSVADNTPSSTAPVIVVKSAATVPASKAVAKQPAPKVHKRSKAAAKKSKAHKQSKTTAKKSKAPCKSKAKLKSHHAKHAVHHHAKASQTI